METPVAFVVPVAGHTEPAESELVAHCRRRLASYKKPSAIHFADALPRNAAGRVAKREVRARLGT
jgi:acyl-CoA synthetase (AMP-forming)/AMP-acid ligase II